MTKTKRLATRADFRSDAFDLNELVCVELLVAAVERGAPPEQCLRPAAGMFLRERQNRVECLERLLREKQRLAERGESRGEDTRLARVVETCARDIFKFGMGRLLHFLGRYSRSRSLRGSQKMMTQDITDNSCQTARAATSDAAWDLLITNEVLLEFLVETDMGVAERVSKEGEISP